MQLDRQISQMEKSVTHLLVATKQLLETLTQWSRKQASETEVSDVYVRLGYEFNLACRAYSAVGVDTSDLGPVPDLLRTILEDTLSQDASPQSLDRYLPRIRDIIINLLHGLKKKQNRLRTRQQKETIPGRQASAPNPASVNASNDRDGGASSPTKRPWARRYGSSVSAEDTPILPRSSSASAANDLRVHAAAEGPIPRQHDSQVHPTFGNEATLMSIPVNDFTPVVRRQPDAIGALQRTGDLERRASRRFSAYQIQKHLGAPSNGVSILPPQNSPVPNRGPEIRESMNAMRVRNTNARPRPRPAARVYEEPRPTPQPTEAAAPPQPPSTVLSGTAAESADEPLPTTPSPSVTPETKPLPPPKSHREFSIAEPHSEAAAVEDKAAESSSQTSLAATAPETPPKDDRSRAFPTPSPPDARAAEHHPPERELTLFLQYRSKLKKYTLPEGPTGLTLGRLQLAFIEKFAWNTQHNGGDLPEIYIQDPASGVRYELEDMNDVKDRSVLVLNVDTLDEVRRHVDEGFGGVRALIDGVSAALQGQESVMQHVSDRQQESAREIARLAAAAPRMTTSGPSSSHSTPRKGSASIPGVDGRAEIQSLRRDLAVLRQTYSSFASDMGASMNTFRSKADRVKTSAQNISVPSYEGDAGRARVNSGKRQLGDESEQLVVRVDDLQDLVEDLRKDVVSRGVRPLPRQLDSVSKSIADAIREIRKMQDFLKREKPVWTKIWESELQLVCEERDQLTMQEELAADLDDDVQKAAQTFELVEQATRQQETAQAENGGGHGVVLRSTPRNVIIEPPALDPMKAKDNMLDEVRALQPNHESRLEAIERAERARRKEWENRDPGRFQKELGAFVQEGRLKKSGGVEETERQRRAKDERARKEVWEIQQTRAAHMEKVRQEKADAKRVAAEKAASQEASQAGDDEAAPQEQAEEERGSTPKGDEQQGGEGESEGNNLGM